MPTSATEKGYISVELMSFTPACNMVGAVVVRSIALPSGRAPNRPAMRPPNRPRVPPRGGAEPPGEEAADHPAFRDGGARGEGGLGAHVVEHLGRSPENRGRHRRAPRALEGGAQDPPRGRGGRHRRVPPAETAV